MAVGARAAPTCADCPEPGVAIVVGALYCARCALQRLVTALLAEVGLDRELSRPVTPIRR